MRVGGNETVAVAHQNQVAVALEFVAGISDDAVFSRLDQRAFGHGEIDAVVLQAVRLRSEAGDDAAAHRPAEGRQGADGFRALDRALGFGRRNRRGKARAMRGVGGGKVLGRGWRFGAGRGGRCRQACRHVRNDDAVADLHPGIQRNIVGFGQHQHRLAVKPGDAVQSLARRHNVDTGGRGERSPRRTGRRRSRDCRCGCGNPRLRRRNGGRGPAPARDHQMLAGMYSPGIGDVVGLHDGGDRHPVSPREHFEGLSGRQNDRRAAFPGPGRGWWRFAERAGDIAVGGLVRAHAAATAGGPVTGIAGEVRQGPAVYGGGALRNRAGRFTARRIVAAENIRGKTAGIATATGETQSN